MLKSVKEITLRGESIIEGKPVVYMSASLNSKDGGNANVTKSISDQELYTANKVQVRADMAEFDQLVFATEDELSAAAEL